MRKMSQDGGDNTSITSGIENDKKPGAGILKSTKNSIKRKVQSFSIECDDTANEPLLHKTKELTEIEKQSAKLLLSKTKTEYAREKGDDKEKLLGDDKIEKPSISDVTGITTSVPVGNGFKAISTATIHNHMDTNVFNNPERSNNSGTPKTQILLELDTCKSMGFSPSPLIFTTAKIHTNGKIQQMEPVHVTAVPILSTIEGGIVKTNDIGSKAYEKSIKNNDKSIAVQQSKEKVHTTVKSTTQQLKSLSERLERDDATIPSTQNIVLSPSIVTTVKHCDLSNIENTTAQSPHISKTLKNELLNTRHTQILTRNDNKKESKLSEATTQSKYLTDTSKNAQSPTEIDCSKKLMSTQATITTDKSTVIKNIQPQSLPDNEKKTSKGSIVIADVMKTLDKEQSLNSIKIMSNDKSLREITSDNNINTAITEHQLQKPLPATSVSSISKSSAIDKTLLDTSPKLTRNETSPVTITSSNILNTLSDKCDDKSIPKSIKPKSTLTNSTTVASQIPTSIKHTAVSKVKPTSDCTKTTSSSPILNLSKSNTTEGKSTSTGKVGLKLTSPISQMTMTTTDDNTSKSSLSGSFGLKTSIPATPNNAATVVSSISKPTTTPSSIKHPSAAMGKQTSTAKQSTSLSSIKTVPSGIPTVSSTVKSSIVSSVSPDKTNSKIVPNPVNKSISIVRSTSKPVSSTTKSPATKETSTTNSVSSSSVKPTLSTSLTKTASKTATKSEVESREAVKDSKGSKP